jgi:hypothetical protein
MLNAFALQTSFFIALGRLFDTRSDSHSIQKLVEATIANPQIFSKASLRQRKLKSMSFPGSEADWLEPSLQNAWEPAAPDLEPLRTTLQPFIDKYKSTYAPVRHKFFAHRAMGSEEALAELWDKTLITEINELLGFVDTLLHAIWNLAWNGVRPDLKDFSHYDSFVEDLNRETEAFIHHLP